MEAALTKLCVYVYIIRSIGGIFLQSDVPKNFNPNLSYLMKYKCILQNLSFSFQKGFLKRLNFLTVFLIFDMLKLF